MITFYECVSVCLNNLELVKEFNRLSGCRLGIEKMIDDATGYDEQMECMKKFIEFVGECIWEPLCYKYGEGNF